MVPWRWLAVAGSVPAVIMVVLLAFMPSSPRRLLSLGQVQKAEKVLRWLRGSNYNTNIEISAIQVEQKNMKIVLFFNTSAKIQYFHCE